MNFLTSLAYAEHIFREKKYKNEFACNNIPVVLSNLASSAAWNDTRRGSSNHTSLLYI